jgi:glycosyltransferase involved in cell wall biosynthesis
MKKLSFIIKSHSRDDDAPLIGGASKNPYRLLKYLSRVMPIARVIYFEGDHGGRESYEAGRASGLFKLYAKTLWQNLSSAPAVLAAFRSSDIVQCHHPHYGLIAALLRRWFYRRVRFVIKAHGTAAPELAANRYAGLKGAILRLNAKLHLWHDRFVLARADAVLCSSEFQRQELVATYGISAERIHCLYNGYDPEHLARHATEPNPGDIRLVLCGRVVPKKGILYAIELFEQLTQSRPDCELILVLGRQDAIEDPGTYRRIERAALEDSRIVIRHGLTESDLYRLFATCTLGLVPSQNYESIPTVVIEMLAAGLPVFATYQWGIPEILPPQFGLCGDLQRDAETLRQYLSHPDPTAFGQLVERIREHFAYPNLVRKYLALYERLEITAEAHLRRAP